MFDVYLNYTEIHKLQMKRNEYQGKVKLIGRNQNRFERVE